METLPNDVRLNHLIKYLPYEDIVNLCSTDLDLMKICQSNETWQYLIEREILE
jgi:hypothetical protein